jgi:hypothetical protein
MELINQIVNEPPNKHDRANRIVEIRPEPVAGGAPRGVFEQIGVEVSSL